MGSTTTFIKFQRIINNSTTRAISKDCRDFQKWNNGEITTRECIEKFCRNNEASEEILTINPDIFTEWLYSLGYIKNRRK